MKNPVPDSNNPFGYNFFYWGPLLCQLKLHSQDLKECAQLYSKRSSLVKELIAGVIKHEHYLSNRKYCKIITPYLASFRHAYNQWYRKPLTKKITVVSTWVNFMVAGEFFPPHIHTGCDFSSVLCVKTTEKLKEEHKKFSGIGAGPGAIEFCYGEFSPYSIASKQHFPEEGDFFIFPAALKHFVTPFISPGERITISADFKLE